MASACLLASALFQSTHPTRGGTSLEYGRRPKRGNFNPPTPRGVGRIRYCSKTITTIISIHPPHAGWDDRPPGNRIIGSHISIHPPHAGWDDTCAYVARYITKFQSTHPTRGGTRPFVIFEIKNRHFNPPTPRGVGPVCLAVLSTCAARFQSTHPTRGGTMKIDAHKPGPT